MTSFCVGGTRAVDKASLSNVKSNVCNTRTMEGDEREGGAKREETRELIRFPDAQHED